VATKRADGTRAGNGYEAMKLEDSNGDGVLNASDANFDKLRVWVDANSDGKTDGGELHGLADFGIVSLDLNGVTGTAVDNGNLLGITSSYSKADGSTHDMADVWFSKDAPKLDELLASAPSEVLPGSTAAAPAAAAPAAATGAVDHRLLPDADNNTPLI
jgi:hypothetical protein